MRRGLRILGLKEEDVEEMSKGAAEKVVLAWWLRERTTVTLRWVSDRLKMGHYTRVTQALSRMRRKPGRKLKQLQRRLTSAIEKDK